MSAANDGKTDAKAKATPPAASVKRFIVSSPGCRDWPEREPSRTRSAQTQSSRDGQHTFGRRVPPSGQIRGYRMLAERYYFGLGCISARAELMTPSKTAPKWAPLLKPVLIGSVAAERIDRGHRRGCSRIGLVRSEHNDHRSLLHALVE